jgi:thiaminase/transcriptional activator TenA
MTEISATTPFTAHLRALADPIWEAQHAHPFVRGIGAGTVDPEDLAAWMRQDYLFLIEYCRLFGLAAARAPDFATLTRFAELLHSTATVEMSLHRAYCQELGISIEELEREPLAPTTRAYTDFLLRVAALGDFSELAAALLPCMWGFSEIGQRLAASGMPDEPRCRKWIETYVDPDFAALAGWCRGLVDRLAQDVSTEQRRRMEEAFLTSSRYELVFWDVAR